MSWDCKLINNPKYFLLISMFLLNYYDVEWEIIGIIVLHNPYEYVSPLLIVKTSIILYVYYLHCVGRCLHPLVFFGGNEIIIAHN